MKDSGLLEVIQLIYPGRLCAGDVDVYMGIFLDTEATREVVIQAGTVIFQYIYHGPDATLDEIRYIMFSRKAAAAVIKPETGYPSTQHISEPK